MNTPNIEDAIQAACSAALTRVQTHHRAFGEQFPSVGAGKRYHLTANQDWLASFWPGILWLTYAATGNESVRKHAEALLPSFEERLDQRFHINHDLGFEFTLSAIAQWRLAGDAGAKALALRAADMLKARYRPEGKYIQAWGEYRDPAESRMIIDCMMNLPLLFWATRQTGDEGYRQVARQHAETCQRHQIRADGSTSHTFFFDPETGAPVGQRTAQGFSDESMWARGQAWAIYGFTMAAEWEGETAFKETAFRVAERFMAELPASGVPWWDLRLPPDAPHYLDSSAGAIAAGGMLRLARLADGERRELLQRAARRLADALVAHCAETLPEAWGMLRHGVYSLNRGAGVDTYLIFGDYYFLETLLALQGKAPDFWGPAA